MRRQPNPIGNRNRRHPFRRLVLRSRIDSQPYRCDLGLLHVDANDVVNPTRPAATAQTMVGPGLLTSSGKQKVDEHADARSAVEYDLLAPVREGAFEMTGRSGSRSRAGSRQSVRSTSLQRLLPASVSACVRDSKRKRRGGRGSDRAYATRSNPRSSSPVVVPSPAGRSRRADAAIGVEMGIKHAQPSRQPFVQAGDGRDSRGSIQRGRIEQFVTTAAPIVRSSRSGRPEVEGMLNQEPQELMPFVTIH